MSSAAIVQSNYIPWKGYFHLIQSVDHFVFLDSVQYTQRDWRSRNRIKTRDGLKWLSVPVTAKRGTPIQEVRIADGDWRRKHLNSLRHAYGKCDCYDQYADFLREIYTERSWERLAEMNQFVVREICKMLGLSTAIHTDDEFDAPNDRNRRLLHIVKQLGADCYVSGPAARTYLDVELFGREGVRVEFFEYPEYPVYPQLYGEFQHRVSILDLLFHMGDASPDYIWRGQP